MSPAVDRGTIADEDYFFSIGTTDPTLTSDQEGWIHYNPTTPELKVWNGTAWKILPFSPVSDAHLRDSAALSVIGRSANSVGDPADIATTSGAAVVLKELGGVLVWGKLGAPLFAAECVETAAMKDRNTTVIKIATHSTGPGVFCVDQTGVPEWRTPTNTPAYPMAQNGTSSISWPKVSGTSFPTSPVDGQIFTHTTHRCMYYYDSVAAGWLSTAVYEFFFSATVDIAVSVYMAMGMSGTQQFTDTLGPRYGFATKVVGMSLQMGASGTGAVDVWDDGVVVSASSAQLSLSAQQGKDTETLMSTTIAAGSIVGVKRTSGTIEGPCLGSVRLRRFET